MHFTNIKHKVKNWMDQTNIPIYWIVGPSNSNKTAAALSLFQEDLKAMILYLSAASPDRCLQLSFGTKTIKELIDQLTQSPLDLLVLDAFENVQYVNNNSEYGIADSRFKILLDHVISNKWPNTKILITSRPV